MGAYQVDGLSKRESRATALPIHDRNHQLSDQRPDESKADHDKYEQRQANPKCETRLRLIAPGDKRQNESEPCNHDHCDEHKHDEQGEQKEAVPFCTKFFPWFGNRSAIANDTVNKNEAAARA